MKPRAMQVVALRRAIRDLQSADALRQQRYKALEATLSQYYGLVRVRAVARHTGISAATISNLFRGRMVVSIETLERVIEALCTVEDLWLPSAL